jgi:DNA processing protein
MPDLIYWIWLSRLPGIRIPALLRYLERFPDAKQLYEASERELRQVSDATNAEVHALMNKSLVESNAIIENCKRLGVNIITLAGERYPDRLANIYDPPILLYVKGNLPDIDNECAIGIVGTRRASVYGLTSAERIAYECAESGALIISGLAEGIDSAAARGALKASGRCIGVLGTGIDIVFPRDNERLFGEVERGGCLISEYPPGERASRFTFPARNRIISGLSLGVCIVEAPERSGSLITASRAAEQGRDVFVVPGSIDLQGFKGSNALLRDGAELVTCGWDIISRHEWRFPNKIQEHRSRRHAAPPREKASPVAKPDKSREEYTSTPFSAELSAPVIPAREKPEGLSDDESKVLDALVGKRTADSITSSTALRPERVMVALTLLELKGLVKNIGNMIYELA